MEHYVYATLNCPQGYSLIRFEVLSPIWTGERVALVCGDPANSLSRTVVGWDGLFCGAPCPVHVARVKSNDQEGYLVWGGNAGVRVLSDDFPVYGQEEAAGLPNGYGEPFLWVDLVNDADLPWEVIEFVTKNA